MDSVESLLNGAAASVVVEQYFHNNRPAMNKVSDSSPRNELKRIWIFAIGSRGDVQPYLAIGDALLRKGYDVTFICSGPSFAAFAEMYGCRAVSFGDKDVDTVMRQNPLMMKGMMDGDILTFFKGINRELNSTTSSYCDGLLDILEKQGPPDLSVIMPLTNYFGWYLAIRHNVPFIFLTTHAAVYNPEHPPFGIPRLPFGLGYYVLHHVMGGSMYEGTHVYDKWLNADVLQKFTRSAFIDALKKPKLPLIVLTSPEIANVLAGDPGKLPPSTYRLVGTTVLQKDSQLAHIDGFGGQAGFARLQHFLEQGEKPVYLGWGSMICKSEEFMVKFCARAVHRSGYRAVILGGFAELSMELLESANIESEILEYAQHNILFVPQAPHEWLFPRMAAVVHHGGAGTTTAALRAGVPSIITPVFADQWDFSYFLRKTGVGIGFSKQFQRVTSEELGDAIRFAAGDSEMRRRAAALGEKLRSENGVSQAVSEIENYWQEYCVSGRFHDIFPGDAHEKRVSQRTWFRNAVALSGVALLAFGVASLRGHR